MPTALKILRGNPGKRAIPKDEPRPRKGTPVCPAWVCEPGKKLWERHAPDLMREGLLTERSEQDFGAWCQEMALYGIYSALLLGLKPKAKVIERYRSLALKAFDRAAKKGSRFGMTPGDQVGLKVPTAPKANDEEFLFGRSDQT